MENIQGKQSQDRMLKYIGLCFFLVVGSLIVWYAVNVFLLAFAAILLAVLLNAIGRWTQKITRLPYPLALILGVIVILAIFALIFWLYSPFIGEQFQLLVDQLPQAVDDFTQEISPYLNLKLFSQEELSKLFGSQKVFAQLTKVFSFTLGSIIGFVIFLVVGFYLSFAPKKYLKGFFFLFPQEQRTYAIKIMNKIGHTLRFWLLGKIISMAVIGILTFIGLWLLKVPLAFTLGLLITLLTFIPYIGPILASVPAILIAFTQSPLTALYVIILYLAIHIAEGYFLSPYIEQKTVFIPPALTIMAQILLTVLVGGLGLALATPLVAVTIALIQQFGQKRTKYKVNA